MRSAGGYPNMLFAGAVMRYKVHLRVRLVPDTILQLRAQTDSGDRVQHFAVIRIVL